MIFQRIILAPMQLPVCAYAHTYTHTPTLLIILCWFLGGFWWNLRFSTHQIISWQTITIWILFLSLSCLIALAKPSDAVVILNIYRRWPNTTNENFSYMLLWASWMIELNWISAWENYKIPLKDLEMSPFLILCYCLYIWYTYESLLKHLNSLLLCSYCRKL